jgi:hypothetical protein
MYVDFMIGYVTNLDFSIVTGGLCGFSVTLFSEVVKHRGHGPR